MEKEEKKPTRIYYIEVLRAMAAIGVVIIHVAGNDWYDNIGTGDWIVRTVWLGLAKFCVPVFFMISGALFLDSRRKLGIRRLFCRNILRLAVFLLVWSFVYQCYHLTVEETPKSVLWVLSSAVSNMARGDTQVHLWFLYTMIGIYLVSPVIKVFTDHCTKRQLQYALLIWFVFCPVYSALSQVPALAPYAVNGVKLELAGAGSNLGYFLLGHYLHRYGLSKKGQHGAYLLGLAGMAASVGLTVWLSVRQGNCQEAFFGYSFPGIVFWSAAVYLFVKEKAESWQGIRKPAQQIGRYSLGIYGCHMLVLFFLWRMGINSLLFPSALSVPVLAAVIFLCAMGISWVLQKIPGIGRYLA